MGFLAGAKALLFGGGKTTEKVLDGTISGIDKMFYTDEEKADNKGVISKLKIKALELYHSTHNNVRSIARRELAYMFASCYLTLIMGSAILACFDLTSQADHLYKLSQELSLAVSLILGFYFTGYYAEKIISKFKKKDEE